MRRLAKRLIPKSPITFVTLGVLLLPAAFLSLPLSASSPPISITHWLKDVEKAKPGERLTLPVVVHNSSILPLEVTPIPPEEDFSCCGPVGLYGKVSVPPFSSVEIPYSLQLTQHRLHSVRIRLRLKTRWHGQDFLLQCATNVALETKGDR